MSLPQKTVLLTGASKGIGKATRELLSSSGQYTILAPTRQEMQLDDAASVDRYMREHGRVDILINNAGLNILKPIDQIDDESVRLMMSVNLESPLRLIRHVSGYMKQQKYGRIVNISSIWSMRSKEYRTLYSMAKTGLNGMTRALARELGPYGILVNSVCPGYVDTEMTRKNVPPEEQARIAETIPLGRFAQPGEIARCIRFLISEENTYINGQTLVIDGGFLA
jgi:3-oxoacyl-[acyl-carrier protein] reductase